MHVPASTLLMHTQSRRLIKFCSQSAGPAVWPIRPSAPGGRLTRPAGSKMEPEPVWSERRARKEKSDQNSGQTNAQTGREQAPIGPHRLPSTVSRTAAVVLQCCGTVVLHCCYAAAPTTTTATKTTILGNERSLSSAIYQPRASWAGLVSWRLVCWAAGEFRSTIGGP